MRAAAAGDDGAIRLGVLGGFLGAGKSTWLRHQLHCGAIGDVHVLVNEAAEIPVDHLFAGKAAGLTVLAGGCACCEGAAGLRAALRGLCDGHDRAVGAGRRATPELWLETSGLADPRRIVELIAADAMLARRIQVAEVVLIVDAANLRQQLADTGLVVRQIQSATRLVLAKADLVDAAELAQACATLRLLNPAAAIEASERGTRRRLQPDAAARPWPVAADGAGAAAATAVSLRPAAGADWGALSVWLSALLCAAGGDVLRVKGVIATPAGRLLLQSVRDKVQPPQLLPPAPEGQEPAAEAPANALVVIGRNLDEARLRASLAYWTGGS